MPPARAARRSKGAVAVLRRAKPRHPKWARRVIYGALGYFVLPLDAIPDLAPLVGYTDDLGVMTAALATVAFAITDDVKAQARGKLDQWLGPAANDAAGNG